MAKTALIFGISGQDGAYLAKFLLEKGYSVSGTSRDRESIRFENLRRLKILDQVTLRTASLADFRSVVQVIKEANADEIYNLAGQSSVSLSFDQPVESIDSTVNGTISILEAMRFLASKARLYNASSSECFGNTVDGPANEQTSFRPCSPYGIGKAAAQWLVSNYREAYGLFACSGILFNHESPLRPARFVTKKIIQGAFDVAEGKIEALSLGNLEIGRDWGWAPEYVDAMWRMLQFDRPEDFVIATGQMRRLQDFVDLAFSSVGLDWNQHVKVSPGLLRPLDIRMSVGNADKARELLGWEAETKFEKMVEKLIAAEREERRAQGNVSV